MLKYLKKINFHAEIDSWNGRLDLTRNRQMVNHNWKRIGKQTYHFGDLFPVKNDHKDMDVQLSTCLIHVHHCFQSNICLQRNLSASIEHVVYQCLQFSCCWHRKGVEDTRPVWYFSKVLRNYNYPVNNSTIKNMERMSLLFLNFSKENMFVFVIPIKNYIVYTPSDLQNLHSTRQHIRK